MTSLTSGRFQPPLVLPEGDTIDFVFRWSNNGTLFTPAVTPVWIFGIKDATTPSGDFLVQVNTASANAGVYTFTVPISSAELQTWLSTATSQSYVALQITDTANGIATTPLLCQITANQNDSGTTPTSANGTLDVAAGKTVTFPLSLTFPSAAGTNGFQLTTDGAGTLTWAASGGIADGDKGDITVSASGATWTIDAGVVTLAKMADMATARIIGRTTAGTGVPELLTISGTGSVAMTTSPSFTTPSLGAATATSINGIAMESLVVGPASATADAIVVYDGTTGRLVKNSVVTVDSEGLITTTGNVIANFCYTTLGFQLGGGSMGLNFLDANELNNIKIAAPAGLFSSDKTQTFQNATGTIALTSDITGGTLAGSFTTLEGTSSATLGTNGGTGGSLVLRGSTSGSATISTSATGVLALPSGTTATNMALTTPALGVATATSVQVGNGTVSAPSLQIGGALNGFYSPSLAGTDVGVSANGTWVAFWNSSWGLVARLPIIPVSNNGTSCGTSGLRWSGVYSVLGDFSGAVVCGTTLAVTGATTLTGLLVANGGITVVGGANLITTNSDLTSHNSGNIASIGSTSNAPIPGDPTKWIAINDNGTTRYIPTWS